MNASGTSEHPGLPRRANYLSDGPISRIWIRRLRPFAAATLVVFGWSTCQPWNYAAAMQAAALAPSESEQSLTRADRAARALIQIMDRLDQQAESGAEDLSAGLAELDQPWNEITAADTTIRADFQAIADHLRDTGAPAEILQRHQAAVQDYQTGLLQLDEQIKASRRLHGEYRDARAGGRAEEATAKYGEMKAKIKEARGHLREKVKEPRHKSLDPNQLPHRGSGMARRDPRMTASDFSLSTAPATLSSATQVKVLSLAATAPAPGAPDLAATVDAPQTPEIKALAASLGNHPLRIFEHVRNQIETTPTWGSIQGAQGCLQAKRCNAMDSASLLVALLRAAGVPARYALGTIELPIDKVKNWAGGFTDGNAALQLIGSSGTPVVGLVDSLGKPVAARMEHVWVEAFLDYVPSRGAVPGAAGDTWVPLDPSFKQFTYAEGVDLASATSYDPAASFRQIADTTTVADPDGAVTNIDMAAIDAQAVQVRNEVRSYVESRSLDTLQELVGGRTIQPLALSAAPASLPYRVLVRGGAVPAVPAAMRHTLRFEVYADQRYSFEPELVWQASLPELAARKITLSYAPATAADEATLRSYLPAGTDPAPSDFPSSLPSYLVHVKPELRVEGQVVASGGSSTLGQTGTFRMVFTQPGDGPRLVDNNITAGTYNAVVLNLGTVNGAAPRSDRAAAVRARLQAGDTAGLTKDDVLGELLHGAGVLYWSELELFGRTAEQTQDVVSSRLPSEGIFSYDLKVSLLFGIPRSVSSGSMTTDVDTDIQAVAARNGDRKRPIDFMAVTGSMASRAESAIWDQMLNDEPTGKGITAVSYIETAARLNIPIYHIDQTNVAAALPKLQVSSAIKSDIQSAVAAGRVVTIPQRSFVKDGFTGVGYIVFDPTTGAAGYMISGGLAGGGFQLPTLHPLVSFLLGALLVGAGIFASGGIAVALALAGIAIIIYDTISTIQNLDSDLSPEAREMITGFLAMLAIVGILLAVIGIFAGSILGFVVFALFWAFLSVMAANILIALAGLVDRRTSNLPSMAELRNRWQAWMRALTGPPAALLGVGA